MKAPQKKGNLVQDDSLFGLLSSYKSCNTYFRVLVSDENRKIVVQLTDNPANWNRMKENKYDKYRELRRLEIGVAKLSVKYLSPENIVRVLGPGLGIRFQQEEIEIANGLEENGVFVFETSIENREKIIQGVSRLLNLSPQKKYEIIEKYMAEDQE